MAESFLEKAGRHSLAGDIGHCASAAGRSVCDGEVHFCVDFSICCVLK